MAALLLSMLGVAAPASADTLDPPVLDAPLSAATVTSNPTFTWSSVPLASKYRIQVSISSAFGSSAYTADVFGTSATPIAELPLGTLYWRVASLDSTLTVGAYSAPRSFTRNQPDAPTLIAPVDARAFVYPSEAPVFQWSAVPGMVNYKVQVDDGTDFVGATTYTTEGTSFSLPVAIPSNSVRYWRVQGVSTTATVTTAWSSDFDLRSFTVTWPDASRPTLLTPADDLVNPVDDVSFSWSPVPGAASYQLQMSTVSDFTAGLVTQDTHATRYRPINTLAADQYYWRVRGADPSGNFTTWSLTSRFKRVWLDELGREARPTVTVTDASLAAGVQLEIDELAISWTPIPRAMQYEFEISTQSSFISSDSAVRRTCVTPHTTWTPILDGDYTESSGFSNCVWTGTSTSSSSSQFLTITGGPYFVRVRAVDKTPGLATFNSPWSNAPTSDRPAPAPDEFSVVANATTATSAAAPAMPLSSPDAGDNPLLTWQPVTGAAAYLVGMARNDTFTTDVVTGGGSNFIVTTQTQLVLPDVLFDNDAGDPYFWFALPCSRWDGPTSSANVCNVGENLAIKQAGFFATFKKKGLPVTGLVGTGTQTDTISLSWADQLVSSPQGGGVKWYGVEVLNSSNVVVHSATTEATGYTPINLSFADGPYSWRVCAFDASGKALAWSPTEAVTKSSSAPANPSSSVTPLRLPVLTWDATSFAKSYEVEIYSGTDSGFPLGNKEGSTLTTVYPAATPADALLAGSYSWRVRQKDSSNNVGPWSAGTPTFTVGATQPSPAAPADASAVPADSLVFGWSTEPDAVRYKFQSSTTNGFGTLFEDITTIGSAYAPIKAYVGGITYYWRVVVLNSDNDLVATSATRSFVAQTTPGAPTASMAAAGTTVTISYAANATGGSAVTGYKVRYRVFNSSTWTIVDKAADTASLALTGLPTSTKYEAQVAVVNAVGTGAFNTTPVTATTATTPGTPTGLKVTPGVGTLTVSWSAPSNGGSAITGYHVRYALTSGGGGGQVTVSGTSTTLSGLTSGAAYTVDVVAQNIVGTGLYATSIQGTPTAPPAPPTPTTPPPTTTPAAPKPPASTSVATALTIAGGKTVMYGGSAALTGTLKTAAGAGIGSKALTLESRPVGSTSWVKAGSATTTSTGAYSAAAKPTTNREFRIVFAAVSPHTASTSATVKVLVAPKITQKLSAKTVKLKKKVVFSGSVSPAHKATTVQLQRLQGNKWVTKKSAKTSATSTYRIVWKTDSKADFYWRVVLPGHADHAVSYSPAHKLTVK